jgi:hypothetical protein
MKPKTPLKIKMLRMTSVGAPEQYEGLLEDGRGIYIRERWGNISVEISKKPVKDVAVATWSKNTITVFDSGKMDLLQLLQEFGIIKIPKKIEDGLL